MYEPQNILLEISSALIVLTVISESIGVIYDTVEVAVTLKLM